MSAVDSQQPRNRSNLPTRSDPRSPTVPPSSKADAGDDRGSCRVFFLIRYAGGGVRRWECPWKGPVRAYSRSGRLWAPSVSPRPFLALLAPLRASPVGFALRSPAFAPPAFAPPVFAPPAFAPPVFAPPAFAPPVFAPRLRSPASPVGLGLRSPQRRWARRSSLSPAFAPQRRWRGWVRPASRPMAPNGPQCPARPFRRSRRVAGTLEATLGYPRVGSLNMARPTGSPSLDPRASIRSSPIPRT